jgi:uncharacterized membrane protein
MTPLLHLLLAAGTAPRIEVPAWLSGTLQHVSLAIGAIGVGVILWGVALGLVRVIALEIRSLRREETMAQREALRHHLVYYLLLGLEFLVAADIVHTILTPTLDELAVLGAIVAIRTVISFSINWELRQSRHGESVPPACRG